ncbi:glycerophosphodiester phosphodiesterase [Aurantiacibacter rhizosphaerae]|uniref:glycerophosphodiester phosphodiesterase n=1 Tax=Aurantiacibacter rhizosphaerae TaxID=2691582 RepID=A0A844XA60_9SPHN|nr:glycerophosphodiester phosphodiesterase [Aurantiacibacter rhizosphaerae]MWV26669.1 glycerophosphodiester phosphodiesterase [Aurantiacibacter rhizosphaerae]
MAKTDLARGVCFALFLSITTLCCATSVAAQESEILVIAHRGASGDRPEHTLAAYELAIEQGADFIEIDLVPTQDGVLVARHENEISGTTDVGERPEFAARLTTRTIDGQEMTGWFTEDFTLAELRTLRATERLPDIRPKNALFDGLYQVPTLTEIITLVRAKEAETGRVIGIYPEIKHPSYFASIGHDVVALLVEQLHAAGYVGEGGPVFIQSFEVEPLKRLNRMTDLPLVQLIEADGVTADDPSRSYDEMVSPSGLAAIAEYADGIGAAIPLLLNETGASTGVSKNAHAAGLVVHGWSARKENAFLPQVLRSSDDDAEAGDLSALIAMLKSAGVDGVFTDDPAKLSPADPGAIKQGDAAP